MLEHSVANWVPDELDGAFLQMSGIWVTYDITRDVGDRVVEVLVRCTDCDVPRFLPLDTEKMYKIALNTFIADGGDGYDVFVENGQNRYSGNLAASTVAEYIEVFSPIYPGIDRRITFLDSAMPCNVAHILVFQPMMLLFLGIYAILVF
ncbi:snake venom 5'-nucleotidase-like [Amphiura filiformis]|uniref:snake venom 5'-nucleotidase-like n=1 Tax=Amphiura filiformis TaxID=82378 RepID=UPI003B2129D9